MSWWMLPEHLAAGDDGQYRHLLRVAPPGGLLDFVDKGEPAEYDHLRALLAPLAMPVFVIPGNHDSREPLRAAFIGDFYLPRDGFLQYAVEEYPVRLVALDTLIPGAGGGEFVLQPHDPCGGVEGHPLVEQIPHAGGECELAAGVAAVPAAGARWGEDSRGVEAAQERRLYFQ